MTTTRNDVNGLHMSGTMSGDWEITIDQSPNLQARPKEISSDKLPKELKYPAKPIGNPKL
jgi:galactose-1-phosphate uridylyltransferase